MDIRRYIAAGAVFAWPLEGGSPLQEARDRHVVTGAPGVVSGPFGMALTFDGSTNYITLGSPWEDVLRFDSGTQDFSIIVWTRPDAAILGGVLVSKEDGVNDGYRFWVSGGGRWYFTIDAIDTFTDTGVVQASEWQCLIGTVDRSDVVTLYLNGVDRTDTQPGIGGEVMATTSVPTIGCRSYDNGLIWHGDIAGVVIVDRCIPAAEALAIATGRAF